jgi:hypothetical protein
MQQQIGAAHAHKVLETVLPRLAPFRDRTLHSIVAALDWDHRLPSRAFTLRLHLCYDEAGRQRFTQAFARRSAEIEERNRYPEFDVPDYAGLPADETYDVDLTAQLAVESMRLVSPWRREIAPEDAARAIAVVRGSTAFADVQRAENERSPALGDLEAVAWTPPCESQQPRWTLDVWWLTSFDGRIGRGWSFLVDLSSSQPGVTVSREFTIRAG